jgi:hypothetical protein
MILTLAWADWKIIWAGYTWKHAAWENPFARDLIRPLGFSTFGGVPLMLKARRVFLLAIIGLAIVVMDSRLQAQPSVAPVKTSEQVYKNIQVLKGIAADRVIPSMQFIAASLGVRCEHCHVEGAFEKDDKKAKQTARKMMEMMFALNQNSFEGKREVTCYSCHRGNLHPVPISVVAMETSEKKDAAATAPSVSEGEVLDKYLQAVGGSALTKINTAVAKGKVVLDQGVEFPIEIRTKTTGMRSVSTHLPNGDSLDVLNGQSGWTLVPGRPLREMNSDEILAAHIDADLQFAADLKSFFAEIKARPDQEIEGHAVSVLHASSPGQPPVELYFDQQSGLLLRMVRYVDSPLGSNPTQIDYSDYRDLAGIKIPFQWTTSRPQGRFTVQLDQAQMNVPIEDTKFAKPDEGAPVPRR